MADRLRLRPASEKDTDVLLEWRNDHRTRMASENTAEIQPDDHRKWMASSLSDKGRVLMIAEEHGKAVGTVRADLKEGLYELSWTVAPAARGRGIGEEMVRLFLLQLQGAARAAVKKGNSASVRVAERAGMTLVREEGGMLVYERGEPRPGVE